MPWETADGEPCESGELLPGDARTSSCNTACVETLLQLACAYNLACCRMLQFQEEDENAGHNAIVGTIC